MPMAWNEPGGGRDNKPNNPWSNKKREPGPPDLEQFFKKLKDRFKMGFSNKFKKGPNTPGFGGSGISFNSQKEFNYIAVLVLGIFLLLYLFSGIYIVEPPERAVITRFGKYIRTEGPGPHWIPVFIEARQIVNVDQVATSDHSGLMLTKDRNIASVGIAVPYRIGNGVDDVKAFLFDVVNPVNTLKQSAESALRQVVGQYTMDEVLTLKRAEIAQAIKEQIIETIKNYHTGIMVLDVSMQFAKAPDEVRAAFDDVIKAAADEERLVNQARAYENEILPKARGTVERLKNEAQAYKQEIILKAEGNVQRFNSIVPEYQKAPKLTQTRLYLDAMEYILSRVSKIVTDPQAGNNYIYLPHDKHKGQDQNATSVSVDDAVVLKDNKDGSVSSSVMNLPSSLGNSNANSNRNKEKERNS